jgi:hypothetical protein
MQIPAAASDGGVLVLVLVRMSVWSVTVVIVGMGVNMIGFMTGFMIVTGGNRRCIGTSAYDTHD